MMVSTKFHPNADGDVATSSSGHVGRRRRLLHDQCPYTPCTSLSWKGLMTVLYAEQLWHWWAGHLILAWSNEGCLAVCYGTWSFVWSQFSGERPWGDFATCAMAWLQSITGREMGNNLTTHILSDHDVIQFWTQYLGPITQKCVCVTPL